MELQTFYDNFELMAAAPNGIQKLREMILKLAVMGKLVPQDPNDEPADKLLKRIQVEKEKYIIDKKIRAPKFKPLFDDVKPFDLPDNWIWINLDEVAKFITDYQANGSFATLKKNVTYYSEPNYAVLIRLKDLRTKCEAESDFVYTDEQGYNFLRKSSLYGGEILVANVGAGVGTVMIMPKIKRLATLAPNMFLAIISELVDHSYFKYFSQSPIYWSYIKKLSGGTGQPKMNKKEYKSIRFPLPPVKEQHRIVAKVDELMALCDDLEAKEQHAHQICIQANDATINKLLRASTPDKFNWNWERIHRNFDLLYSEPENVAKLRQAILQLAMMGKLVPQDPGDEPASVLLEKVNVQREHLIKKGKIKKTKSLNPVNDKEAPYRLPMGWEWTKLGMVSVVIMGQSPPGNTYNDAGDGVPLINGPVEFSDGHFGKTIKSKFTTQPKKFCKKDDLLLCVRGSTTGRTNIASFDACIGRGVAAIRSEVDQKYLNWFIASQRNYIFSIGTGSTFPSISYEKIAELVCPIPPLAEQHRIVAKVDELMALCNALEDKLSRGQSDNNRLLGAAVADLLAA